MAKECSIPQGYIISGYVRRGGGEPKEVHWNGRAWSKTTAKLYRFRRDAERAAGAIDVRNVDSIAIYPMPGDLAY